MESVWKIEGMHCRDCAVKVEAALKDLPEVSAVKVHYLKRRATLTLEHPVATETIVKQVAEAGYRAEPLPGEGN
jgi:copper chaperone CopZ